MDIRQAIKQEIVALRQRRDAVSPTTVILILRFILAILAAVPDAVAAVRELVEALKRALERAEE